MAEPATMNQDAMLSLAPPFASLHITDTADMRTSGRDTAPSNSEPVEGIALTDVYECDDDNVESSHSSSHSSNSATGSLSSLTSERPLYKNILCFVGYYEGLPHPDEEHATCVACGDDCTHDQFGLEEGASKKPTKTGCGDAFHMSCLMQLVTTETMQRAGIIHYSRQCPLCRVEWFPNPTPSHIALLNPHHDGVDECRIPATTATSLVRIGTASSLHHNREENVHDTDGHVARVSYTDRSIVSMRAFDDPINVQQQNIREAVHNFDNMGTFIDRTVQDALAAFYRAHRSRIEMIEDKELRTLQLCALVVCLDRTNFNWNYARHPMMIQQHHFECDISPLPLPEGFPAPNSPDYQPELRKWWAARECLYNVPNNQLSTLELALYRRQTRVTLQANEYKFSSVRDIERLELGHQVSSLDYERYISARQLEHDFQSAEPPVLPSRLQEESYWLDPENRARNQLNLLDEHRRQWQRNPDSLLSTMWDNSASWPELCRRMERL